MGVHVLSDSTHICTHANTYTQVAYECQEREGHLFERNLCSYKKKQYHVIMGLRSLTQHSHTYTYIHLHTSRLCVPGERAGRVRRQ